MNIRLPMKDDSGLVRHGSMMMAGNLVGALCNAAFHMVVGRTLSPAEYGTLVAMLGIVLVASTPMQAVQNTLAHFISRYIQEDDRGSVMPLFLHWLELFVVIGGLIIVGAVVCRGPLATLWDGVEPRLIVVTFSVLAVSLWMNLFFGLLQGMQAFVWLAWVPQAWGVVRLLLGAVLTAAVSATALAALGAQGAGVLAVLLLGLWALRNLQLPPRRARVRPHGTYRYLVSAVICLAGYAMLMNLDTTLARHYFDAESVGLFAKAATIARTAVFLPVPVAAVLFPKVTSAGELTDNSWKLLLRALAFAGLIIAAVVAGCLLLPRLPWAVLYDPPAPGNAAAAVALTRAMVLAQCPLALAYLLLNFEMAQQRFRWCYAMVPCAIAYVAGVVVFHGSLMQVAWVLGIVNSVAAVLLLLGVIRFRRKGESGREIPGLPAQASLESE